MFFVVEYKLSELLSCLPHFFRLLLFELIKHNLLKTKEEKIMSNQLIMNNTMDRLNSVKIGIGEFLWKFFVVLCVIMPICVGGCFWIGMQVDAIFNIHLLKFIMPFVGSGIGFFFTSLLLMMGHNQSVSVEETIQPYSDRLVSRREEIEALSLSKPSIPSRRKTI